MNLQVYRTPSHPIPEPPSGGPVAADSRLPSFGLGYFQATDADQHDGARQNRGDHGTSRQWGGVDAAAELWHCICVRWEAAHFEKSPLLT